MEILEVATPAAAAAADRTFSIVFSGKTGSKDIYALAAPRTAPRVKIRIDTTSYLGKFLFGYRLTNAPPDAFTDWACVELLHRVDSASLFLGGKAVSEYACRAKFLVPATTLVAPLSTTHACFHHMCNLPQDDKKQIKLSLVKHNHDDRVVLMPTARNVLRPELELDARLEDDVESDFGFQMPGHPSGKSVSAAELSLLFSPLDPVTRRNIAAMKVQWTAPAQAPAAGAPAQHSPAGAPAHASHASVSPCCAYGTCSSSACRQSQPRFWGTCNLRIQSGVTALLGLHERRRLLLAAPLLNKQPPQA
ncbi:hypothetical protein CAOG_08719 [Capsaspora owczarzaki ATCC 30864]|uniref:hypothetical protein n=1 Tax=Capsaspora owczarzaki (strain ATCC 30864) TaxID=595528 RepID=UPI00035217E9|nr:hypothetical protein CAOG_08719 [Capsaspora owczarzaki ATCC 30864]|eukprot:XP_011270339.1 hypothetical protein CAOG_08719 [Capsaspora owczarzaki ATCC 30864]